MLTTVQAIVLGLLQGVTELFPVSSLGHSVILPTLLGWQVNQQSPYFLPFLVLTHLATALVLIGYFWRDWVYIIQGILRSFFTRKLTNDRYAKLGWLLIIGTIPAGILGLVFEKKLEILFASPQIAAIILMANGLLLLGCEVLRRRKRVSKDTSSNKDARIVQLSFMQTLGIGAAQSLALLPGFSRTGSALGGGLLAGLPHEDAARFSFLLATPLILAAGALELPHLASAGSATLTSAFIGALCTGVATWFSVRFLLRYFQTRTLVPFGVYCVVAGLIASIILF